MVNTVLAISQAGGSILFLTRYSMLCKWWKTVSGRVLAGLLACLFTITITLVVTGSNEGLSSSPLPVTIGRIGFTVVVLYGAVELEIRSWKRRHSQPVEDVDPEQKEVKSK